MRLFDPFAYLSRRSSSDHYAMAQAGIDAVVEPCGWPGRPRTQLGSFLDDFNALVGFERSRAGRFGIRYLSALALSPREANDPNLALPVLNLLPEFLAKECVVALGETGYDAITQAEDAAFEWQLDLARRFDLPVIVRVPAAERARAVRRALAVVRRSGIPEARVLIGPNDEETLPILLASGCWAAHALCGRARFDAGRMAPLVRRYGAGRIIVGSGADWDLSDPLGVARLAAALADDGMEGAAIERLLWSNPAEFFAQSGRAPAEALGPARGASELIPA